jgi:hypothetical protein
MPWVDLNQLSRVNETKFLVLPGESKSREKLNAGDDLDPVRHDTVDWSQEWISTS